MLSSEKTVNNLQYQLFIVSISLLAVANTVALVFFRGTLTGDVLALVDALLTPFFLVDFGLRMIAAQSKWRYFFIEFGWADFIGSLWLPGWDVLRLFRVYRVVNIIRQLPKTSGQTWGTLRRERANSIFSSMIMLAILVIEIGGIAVLHFEGTNANANILTAGDALWWGIVTIATVGYGDKYPITPGGRFIGSAEIITGVAVFGTISAYLASAFIGRRKQTDEKEATTTINVQDVLTEVKRLSVEMEQRHSDLETRLTTDQDRHASTLEVRLGRIEALLGAAAEGSNSSSSESS